MNILLSGFEAFNHEPINPSQMILEALPENSDHVRLTKTILPVDHKRGPDLLLSTIQTHQPDAILAFGQAMGRAKISLERVAINLLDDKIPDNTGITFNDKPIIPDGPAAYFSTLPIRTMLDNLLQQGIPAEISLSAGSYRCNQVFYVMMHSLASKHITIPAGFIHLPALPQQAARSDRAIPSMSLDLEIEAANILIMTLTNSLP